MKSTEIAKTKCAGCGEPICSPSLGPIFYRLKVTGFAADRKAAQQVGGLATMFDDEVPLAEIFSPDPHIFKPASEHELWVCHRCVLNIDNPLWILNIMEFKPTEWADSVIEDTMEERRKSQDGAEK